MLILSQKLPQACLIGQEGAVLAARVAASGGLWFSANPDDVLVEGDTISGWRARVGGADLRPAAPNQGNSQFSLQPNGFVLRAGVNCGLTLAGAAARCSSFTAAVIFSAPQEDIKTLFSLKNSDSNDMIFLSESEGQIFAKDREGGVAVFLPSPKAQARARMAIVSYTGQALHLWADGALAISEGVALGVAGPMDAFVGCRSNRKGITKTLGAGLIHDVLFWHGRALLDENNSPELAALHDYFTWAAP